MPGEKKDRGLKDGRGVTKKEIGDRRTCNAIERLGVIESRSDLGAPEGSGAL